MEKNYIYDHEKIKRLLISVIHLLLYDKEVKFHLSCSGSGSYTDGKSITIGIPDIVEDKNIEESTILLKGLTGHECQHVRSSNFSVLENYTKDMEEYFFEKYHLYSGGYLFKEIFNAIEDGRIESILSYNYLGFVKYLNFLNISFWEVTDYLKINLDDFSAFSLCICYLATLGIYPKNYIKKCKNTNLDKNLQKIKKYISKGINAYSCEDCANVTKKIVLEIEPFLVKFLTKTKEKKINDEKNKYTINSSSITSSETDFNQIQDNNGNQMQDNNNNQMQDNNGNQMQDNNGNQMQDNNGNQIQDNNGNQMQDNNGNNSKLKVNPIHIGNNIDSNININSIDSDNENLIIKTKRTIIKITKKEIQKNLFERENNIVQNDDKLDIKDVIGQYSNNLKYKESNIYNGTMNFPNKKIQINGNKLKEKLKYILKNKSIPDRKSYKGLLNSSELWQIKMLEPKMFIKKGRKEIPSYVCYILLDSSGSMNMSSKSKYAIDSLSLIEEGLNNLIPLKIVSFSSYDDEICHNIIKNFNDDKKINYTKNSEIHFTGGNKDGFSIRIASKELLLRPEKEKILIILSDGLPSDYNSNQDALSDVQEAVLTNKKKGITILPIFFGEEKERKRLYSLYKKMYKENIISCDPKNIGNYLSIILKRTISKS